MRSGMFETACTYVPEQHGHCSQYGIFRAQPSRLCGWCAHQALCPAYGGTPPPFPEAPAAVAGDLVVERD